MHRRTYEAREVLRLLGVKPHVLRYWEQSLPIIRPRRNESGYRVWNGSQLRMLLRIRYLVVERGMSVAAAGNEILHEAEPGTADTKARLEALRSRLITLLLYNRAAGDREIAAASARHGDPPHAEPARSFPLSGDSMTVAPLIPARGEREKPASAAWGRRIAAAPARDEHPATGIVHIPISHLFVSDAPRKTARVLRSLLRHRLAGAGEAPVIVPAPVAAVEQYREICAQEVGSADHGPQPWRVLPVYPVSLGAARWWSPRMSLFIALATDTDLESWEQAHGVSTAYVWAPDDPSVPASVSAAWAAAAAAHPQGLAIAVQQRKWGTRLPEAMLLHLPTWRPALVDTLAAGRWTLGRVHPQSLVNETSSQVNGGWEWRFDLWQRDLLELAPPWVTLPPPRGPVPWYGEGWRREVTRIWPAVEG